jgi:hypothetical protein
MRSYPHERFSRAMRTTRSSSSLAMRGRPTDGRCGELTSCWSMHLRCQARMVSGCAIVAISCSACRPSLWPISARVFRSASVNSSRRALIWLRRMRFSVARYALRSRSASSTVPVIDASSCFQSIDHTTRGVRSFFVGVSMGYRTADCKMRSRQR